MASVDGDSTAANKSSSMLFANRAVLPVRTTEYASFDGKLYDYEIKSPSPSRHAAFRHELSSNIRNRLSTDRQRENKAVTNGENGASYGEQKLLYESQPSAAAYFFARASQKLKLNSSPHKKKKRGFANEDGVSVAEIGGFSNLLHRSPPTVPSALLRKLGQKEANGIGKVKVILKVCGDIPTPSEDGHTSGAFSMDKKKKQIALYEPVNVVDASEDRQHVTSAPKLFAFDALFAEDDPQVEICANALTDVIHAVISGNDGCIFSFGNAKIGKTRTMIGSSESNTTPGAIPCSIAWLYRVANEQKAKTGTRFSIRVSAIEITAVSQQIRDLLTDYASDTDQSPGIYLKNDPILGSHLQNRSELRAPLPEKAAFYLDAALGERNVIEESHFLYTLHVYQYNVANRSAVAGGRSRLYLIDLAGNDLSKSNSSLSISNLGNVLLAIFNGQKHLPYRDHKITQVLKECLSSLTCHATVIAHISPLPQNYHETLATVQYASRIHRIRRRRIKFVGVSNGINTTTDENGRLTSSSDFDPSSSEQSADTVIYIGPSEETDGEHPPVCIPSLNSIDTRGVISKVLREADPDFARGTRSMPSSPYKIVPKLSEKPSATISAVSGTAPGTPIKKHHSKPSGGYHSAHSSPVRTAIPRAVADITQLEERWIDGPRISKSKIVEARNVQQHLMRKEGQKLYGKREMWVDGPLKRTPQDGGYGFMDSHKKNMIRRWVENQSLQLHSRLRPGATDEKKSHSYKTLTVFKTCENGDETDNEGSRGQGSGQEEDVNEESIIANRDNGLRTFVDDRDSCQRTDLNGAQKTEVTLVENDREQSDDDMEIEIIEVEEPEEPVPMQDCCLQVTEEDIALCMAELEENPLPEVDQKEHPLRILSEENLTIVSTFTDSLSVANDLDRLFPKTRWCLNQDSRSQSRHNIPQITNDLNKDDTRSQLSKLHKLYENKFDTGTCLTKYSNGDAFRTIARCQSVTLPEFNDPGESNTRNNDFENDSIVSEPAYITDNLKASERLCENCKTSLTSIHRIAENANYWSPRDDFMLGKLRSLRHMKNIMNLRHPDGASNPNLQEMEGNRKFDNDANQKEPNVSDDEDDESAIPLPLTSKLLTLNREGFDGGFFTKFCDSANFDVVGGDKFCKGLKKTAELLYSKNQYSRASVKKLSTYRVELKETKK